ncbi:MAG: ABC transporter permease [Bacteroidota bacterium]
MIKNYLKIAIRNFVKERFYGLINVLGLSIGIASSLVIMLYVAHDMSYDDFHPDVDRTYRVNQTLIWSPSGGIMSSTTLPLAGLLASEYPEVESALRINTPGRSIVRYEDDQYKHNYFENHILAADSNFFEFFDFKLKEGDPAAALKGLNKVVISSETAYKYFGDEPALGKTILFGDDRTPMEVTGVTEVQPTNSHFNFDFLLSMYSNPNIKRFEWSWIWTQVVTYVKLRPDADPLALEEKMKSIGERSVKPALASTLNMDYDELVGDKGGYNFYLQPVQDIYLKSASIGNRIGPVGDLTYGYIFSIIAFMIMFLASINFVNLSTARATIRAKEIGVRKVMGSLKKQLLGQFLLESVIICTMATLMGFGLMELLKFVVQDNLGVEIHLSLWDNPILLGSAMLLPLALGILSGLYPAFNLSSIKPVSVLKGRSKSDRNSFIFRNALVVAQFTISVTLISCTFIVYQQLSHFIDMDTGYDRENIISIDWAHNLGPQLESFAEELKQQVGADKVTISMDAIGRGNYEDIFAHRPSAQEETIAMMKADDQFLETMGIELLLGRFFDRSRAADLNAVVINEATMKIFGWSEANVLGQVITYPGDDNFEAEVIGVVKNFHFQSLREPINPYIFYRLDAQVWGDKRVVLVKTTGQDVAGLLSKAKQLWKDRVDAIPFQYDFADEEFARQYEGEHQLGDLFALFSGFALLIAAMGLLGLSAYTISVRNKEIGIRKTLGATVAGIAIMLNRGYTKLIIISLVVSIPIAIWAMENWLRQFEARISVDWTVFLITGAIVVLVTWLTVGFQSIKAALLDPVKTLRDE